MSILLKKTIVHLLDRSMGMPLLSQSTTSITDEVEGFLTKNLMRFFNDHSMYYSTFEEESSFKDALTNDYNFYNFCEHAATKWYAYMMEDPRISSGDLIVTEFEKEDQPYLCLLKFNYKEEFTHYTEQTDDGSPVHKIIKHQSIFPSASKLQEGVLIQLNTLELTILDTTKSRYLGHLLQCKDSLTVKEKIKVIEHIVTDAIEEHFENKVEGISFAKNTIAQSIDTHQGIAVEEVLDYTFEGFDEIKEGCKEKFQAVGITEPVISLSKPESVTKKYSSHQLKTNTGIELKLPTQMLQDTQCIEFINEPDGTLSILLKNIKELINK